MIKLLTSGVAAASLAGSVLALAAPAAAQSGAIGGAHAAMAREEGRSFQGRDAGRSFEAGRGDRSVQTASRFDGGERGRDRDGGGEGWRGGDDGGRWGGGWGYPGYGYSYGYGGFGYGLALGAAIGGAYYGGYPYYAACTGRRAVWDPYYGRYVVRAFRYAC